MDLFGSDIIEEEDYDEDIEEQADEASVEIPFVHPRSMAFVTGHDDIEKQLVDLYNSGRMPHAMVFTGSKGIGKATMAYRFARFLLKNGIKDDSQMGMFGDAPVATSLNVSADDSVFRRLASGGHADFFSTEKKFDEAKNQFKNALDVDEVRKIAPFIRMTSSEGGWRVVIVDDADSMTRNAQNALLKILEEPPSNSVLILVAHNAGGLIPTIRSRARYIPFRPLNDAVMKDLLDRASPGLGTKDTASLISLSGGSFGKALQYLENKAPETLSALMKILEQGKEPWIDIHKMADILSGPGSDTSYKTFRELMEWVMHETARSRARGIAPPAGLNDFLKNSSLEELLKICENLENHFGRAEGANLDRRQTVLGAFSLIAA